MSTIMGIDIETYSSAPLPKCGVYRYTDAPDFEVLLFSYAYDDEPVVTIDLACGETLPSDVIAALNDPTIIKVAMLKKGLAVFLGEEYLRNGVIYRNSIVDILKNIFFDFQNHRIFLSVSIGFLQITKKILRQEKQLVIAVGCVSDTDQFQNLHDLGRNILRKQCCGKRLL